MHCVSKEISLNLYKTMLRKFSETLQSSRSLQRRRETVSENCDVGYRACILQIKNVEYLLKAAEQRHNSRLWKVCIQIKNVIVEEISLCAEPTKCWIILRCLLSRENLNSEFSA